MSTLAERASINIVRQLANKLNAGEATLEFVKELTKSVRSDAQIREFVSRSIENEMIRLQFGKPEGGDRQNDVFDPLFDAFLEARKPNASGIEVFKGIEPTSKQPAHRLHDLLAHLRS